MNMQIMKYFKSNMQNIDMVELGVYLLTVKNNF